MSLLLRGRTRALERLRAALGPRARSLRSDSVARLCRGGPTSLGIFVQIRTPLFVTARNRNDPSVEPTLLELQRVWAAFHVPQGVDLLSPRMFIVVVSKQSFLQVISRVFLWGREEAEGRTKCRRGRRGWKTRRWQSKRVPGPACATGTPGLITPCC